MFRFVLLCVGMSALISGCALQEFGSSLRYNIKGEYYLQQNNFEGGRQAFEEALQTDPASPQALYYYGRFLLAEDQAGAALPYLEKAVTYNPGDAEYHYWLGTAFGANDMSRKERASYETALRLDPKHGPAMTALANNLLQAGELERSYQLYQEALQLWPENPQALYNRGVILKKLGREPEEKQAWKLYLDSYPSGSFARIATERLNSLGDSSYRNYQLGARTVTLSRIIFLPLSAELSPATLPSLDLVGTAVSNMNTGKLDIIVYQQNNPELAKQRALSIRFYLEKKFPNLRRDKRIRLSWFGIPEERTVLGRKVVLDESVQMFLAENGIPKVEAERESAGTTPSPQKMHKLQ